MTNKSTSLFHHMSVSICFYYNSVVIIFCFKYFEIKFLKHFVKMKIFSGVPVARRAAKRSPISNPYMKKKETHELIFSWLSWLMVLLEGAYAWQRQQWRWSRATWRPYSKLQVDRDMQPWFTVYVFGIGYPYYDQLTPVKTRYPLTGMACHIAGSS